MVIDEQIDYSECEVQMRLSNNGERRMRRKPGGTMSLDSGEVANLAIEESSTDWYSSIDKQTITTLTQTFAHAPTHIEHPEGH